MLAFASLIIGIVLAVIILGLARGRASAAPGWFTLVFGLTALAALLVAMQLTGIQNNPDLVFWNISIALSFAAVVIGIGTVAKGDRRWPTWVGLIAGLIPAIFWLWFTVGNIIGLGG